MQNRERIIPANQREGVLPEKLRRRLEVFEKAYVSAAKKEQETHTLQMPELPFFNEAGVYEVSNHPQTPGNMTDACDPETNLPVIVKTDCGAVCGNRQEIATDKIMGCACVLIVGKDKKMMLHLTPSGNFSYLDMPRNLNSNAEYIANVLIQQMKKNDMELKDSRVIILGNLGQVNENDKNYYDRQQQSWNKICDFLKNAGVPSIISVELPLSRTSVYHSPDKPDHVAVVGFEAAYKSNGSISENLGKVHGYWLPLDQQTNFDIKRPLSTTEKQQLIKERIIKMKQQGRSNREIIAEADRYQEELDKVFNVKVFS
ncbi:MAG: hypothetical protein A2233_01980 [Candidatus Kerfeldbacteria bacterium RIFOXYA2_FULL_38_24]|uniref:Uncharacterized protein n=1 Tax=Candidatus Kerfeldbacteria bacterium RIFOXYB2_FULL_38_14 TaxID=1798547 RepID=A0A1G2BEV7_9BACT|nr:MAG: hypothetical protein A2319_04580 [Candidatus Kerfeldbacteria bacterium RIFOXYB2_FULL_38_14]OGY87884.1 MAG: hypothetical protein A2233_01980 [Candidatus Kerfeldbacteria bacterium RIFOXYA2_FULL_38_24]OGY88700.1 MAG: hypothetical protein A2458_03625 [Candidatus Kerfeldbacteria bacterium RIFOXYC2_FULL_38_9]